MIPHGGTAEGSREIDYGSLDCEPKIKKKRIDVAGGGTWSAGGVGVDVGVATPPPLLQAPSFVVEPPALVEFSNGTGAWIHCVARGHPPPQVTTPGS